MKTLCKVIGLFTTAFIYHTIQTSRTERYVKQAYTMGVEDGVVIERHNAKVKSDRIQAQIIADKTMRYVNGVK